MAVKTKSADCRARLDFHKEELPGSKGYLPFQ